MNNNIIKMRRGAKISDSFWFYEVIGQESIAKNFIEKLLNVRIKSICKNEMGNRIRFEVLVDDNEKKCDVEIHRVTNIIDLGKRFRYYQDIRDLEANEYYKEYKKSYIIFLCEFDYFKKGFPIYTFENRAVENSEITLDDETYKIILNMDYAEENKKMVSNDIAEFLSYMKNGIVGEYSCDLVKNIQEEFLKVKSNKNVIIKD